MTRADGEIACVIKNHYTDIGNGLFKCNLCNLPRSGKNKGNLRAHLKSKHFKEFNEHYQIKANKSECALIRLRHLQGYIRLVTIDKRPLNAMLDSGLVALLKPESDKLNAESMTINKRVEVKEHIIRISKKIKEIITHEVRDKIVAAMIDVVTKHQKSILGITIRYVINGKVVERGVGMVLLEKAHTAEYLSEEIWKCLREYGLSEKQVIAVTSDNARNMIAAINKLVPQVRVSRTEAAEEERGRKKKKWLPNKPKRKESIKNDSKFSNKKKFNV